MFQIPLSDLDIAPGHVVEWRLRPPRRGFADAALPHKPASYNQAKHFAAAIAGRKLRVSENYWVAMTFRIDGPPDETALAGALELFVRRHEVLRCGFRHAGPDQTGPGEAGMEEAGVEEAGVEEPGPDGEHDGTDLEATIIAPGDVALDRTDVGRFDTAADTRAYLARRFDEKINALAWPLFLTGVVIGDDGATVFLAFDHIVCDGVSLVAASSEIQTSYAALRDGVRPRLPEVGSYLDFGVVQRDRYADLTVDAPELAYWRGFVERNGDFFPRIPLDFGVTDGEMAAGQMRPAANETTYLMDDAQATAFERTCQEHGGKLFTGLLAAVGMALHRVTGVATYRGFMPVGERREPEFRHAFGWFVNTLPVEFALTGPVAGTAGSTALDFAEVLVGARDGFREMIRSIDVPFIKAWQLLGPRYFNLRGWPYPVNFYSFLDYRKLPGAAHQRDWRLCTIPQASHANTGNMWLLRNVDGVHLNTIFADTPQGRASMAAYRTAIRTVLADTTHAEVTR